MIYSDVVQQGLILPRKAKYTVADVNMVMVGSLFSSARTFSHNEAVFIVKCSAIFHGTDYSKTVKAHSAVKAMFTEKTACSDNPTGIVR